MTVHEKAAVGFTNEAEAYERGRPEYPAAMIAHLVEKLALGPGKVALDLGAGTGKLTRALVPSGARLIAVEPVEAMRKKLEAAVPEAKSLAGTAEVIPLGDGSVDAVVVAQAFHWFDGKTALKEIARVLRPGGHLALVWNVRDERVAWIRALTALLEPYEAGTPRYKNMVWREAFRENTSFGALEESEFPNSQRGGHGMVFDRMSSISFIAALPPPEKAAFVAQLEALLTSHPETRDHPQDLELPYQTRVSIAAKR